MFKRKKIGLALGSGTAKGFALVGVLKVFENCIMKVFYFHFAENIYIFMFR